MLKNLLQNLVGHLRVNPYKPRVLFMGNRQTVEIKIICSRMQMFSSDSMLGYAVKLVKKSPSKLDKTKILMTNGSLMKVEGFALEHSAISLTCIKQ